MELLEEFRSWMPGTEERVPRNTAPAVNQKIETRMRDRLEAIGQDPERIEFRLAALEKEWDVERALEANAAAAVLAGLALGVFAHRRFLFLPAAVGIFLMQHAVQGWCPPMPALRRLGFRTTREIEAEREALLARRCANEGDDSASAE